MSMESEFAALKAEVRRLGNIEAVKKLTAEYMQAMHDARWDDTVACFSDRASYDHGALGHLTDKAAIRRFYTEFIRFLARNPGIEAGEVSERGHRVVAAGI